MRKPVLIAAAAVLFVLHQDFWFWRRVEPMVLGFLPIGLFYHACFAIAASLLMVVIVHYAWPAHLEREIEQIDPAAGSPPPVDTPEVRQ